MVSSKAATPEEYLAQLPPERAALVGRVRQLVNDNLPQGYREGMSWGMIAWEVPLELYADTYNGQPLAYAGLAAQKNHVALYLNCVYASRERTQRLKAAYAAAGKTLDMGKSCIRLNGPNSSRKTRWPRPSPQCRWKASSPNMRRGGRNRPKPRQAQSSFCSPTA